MNKKSAVSILIAALCIAACFCGPAFAAVITNQAAATPGLTISEMKLYPGTLMPGESGTGTITLKNTGDYSIYVDGFIVYSVSGVELTVYDQKLGNINPGDEMTASFAVKASNKCGSFYPYITVNYQANTGIENQHYYAKIPANVVVDDKSISISVLNRPDFFQPDTTQTLSLVVGNVRANDIEGVELSVSGTGVTSREGKVFVGSIPANSSQEAKITILTTEETDEVTLTAAYRNGANWHTDSIKLPIYAGVSKTGADLIINNVEVKKGANYTTIAGDVNNAGLSTAKSVILSTLDTTEAGPYSEYVVGSLDTDGLSGFTVTFKTSQPEVVLLASYKDAEGNEYFEKKTVKLTEMVYSGNNSAEPANAEASPVLPTILIILAAAVILVLGIVAWRKGLFHKKQ